MGTVTLSKTLCSRTRTRTRTWNQGQKHPNATITTTHYRQLGWP